MLNESRQIPSWTATSSTRLCVLVPPVGKKSTGWYVGLQRELPTQRCLVADVREAKSDVANFWQVPFFDAAHLKMPMPA